MHVMADADMVDDLAGDDYSWYNSTLVDMWEEQTDSSGLQTLSLNSSSLKVTK